MCVFKVKQKAVKTVKKQTHTCNKEAEIAIMGSQVAEMHKALMGNGRAGMIEKYNKAEGSFNTWKYIFGSSAIIFIVVTIVQLI